MNVKPKREGFVEDQPTTLEHEAAPAPAAPAGTKRAVPPPEIEPSPEELPPLLQDDWPITIKLLSSRSATTRAMTPGSSRCASRELVTSIVTAIRSASIRTVT